MMSEEKTNFEKSLIMVAKELERLSRIRESRREFEREMASAPVGRPQPIKCTVVEDQEKPNCDLELTCESDSSYDVDEVRYQSFLARNRITSRSNVIKTFVYRVPESAYVVKRTQVYIDEQEEEKPDKSNLNAQQSESVGSEKIPPKQDTKSQNESSTKLKKDDVTASKKANKEKKDVKYTAEDMIMIDDDDDIIGGWTTSDEEFESAAEEDERQKRANNAQPSSSSEIVLDQNEYKSKKKPQRGESSDEDKEGFSSDDDQSSNHSSYESDNSIMESNDQSSALDEEDTTEDDDDEMLSEGSGEDEDDDDESYSLKRPVSQRSGGNRQPIKKLKQGRRGRPRIHPLPEAATKDVKKVAKRGRGRPKVVVERAIEPVSSLNVVDYIPNKSSKKPNSSNEQASKEQPKNSEKKNEKGLRLTRSRSKLVE